MWYYSLFHNVFLAGANFLTILVMKVFHKGVNEFLCVISLFFFLPDLDRVLYKKF